MMEKTDVVRLVAKVAAWLTGGVASNQRHFSKIKKDQCVACGDCVEICPVNAVRLGLRDVMPTVESQEEDTQAYLSLLTEREMVWADTGTSPCKADCPLHVSVQGIMARLKAGEEDQALTLLKKDLPFPAFCGSFCDRRCTRHCHLMETDDPIDIDSVLAFLTDLEEKHTPVQVEKKSDAVAVIGSGPAGLACASDLVRLGYPVTVFEKDTRIGGLPMTAAPDFRVNKAAIAKDIDDLKEMGVEFVTNTEVGADITLDELRTRGYRAFFLAPGAQQGVTLGRRHYDLPGIMTAIDFMKKMTKGEKVSGKVVVIGNGNVAVDVARTAIRQGAAEVHYYTEFVRDQLPMTPETVDTMLNEGIVLRELRSLRQLHIENDRVTGLALMHVFPCDCVTRNNLGNVEVTDSDLIVVAAGQVPEWGNLLKGTKVRHAAEGHVRTKLVYEMTVGNGESEKQIALPSGFEVYQTDEPDIFVGGDALYGSGFAVDAVYTGREGAESIHRYLSGQSLVMGRNRHNYHVGHRRIPNYDGSLFESVKNAQVLTDVDGHAVRKEADRCLQCGVAYVDETHCIGCGLCNQVCGLK